MSQCKVCGSPMKTIPPGISKKTGKPYNSFEACPKGCQQPREWSKPVERPASENGFKIMADEFINLKIKIEELIKEIRDSIVGQ